MIQISDRIKQETTASGSGNLALESTPSGYRAFGSVYTDGTRFLYVVQHQTTGEWEVGYGYTSSFELVREVPLAGSSATPVTFSSGTKDVFVAHEGKLSAAQHTAVFGDGSDGDLTITSGTTTLTQNANYRNLSISGTGFLVCSGYKVRVCGVLDISAASTTPAIRADGLNGGAGAAGGTAGAVSALGTWVSAGMGALGGAGGAGGTGGGSSGVAPAPISVANGQNGGSGGNAGAGGGGSGGTGGSAGTASGYTKFGIEPLIGESGGALVLVKGGGGGGGGAGGGGDGTAGGGGGAGGNGGNVLDLAAAVLKLSTSTVAGAVRSTGGGGGAGGSPVAGNRGGGGGGGGGSGGYAHIVVGTQIGSKTGWVTCTGGTGGTGGTKTGTGIDGVGGDGGRGGRIKIMRLDNGTVTEVTGAAGGVVVSGTAGGAGGACSGGT